VNLDGGALPLGSAPKWLAGGVTPTVLSVATNWTELTALIGEKVEGVAVQNVVADAVANLTEMASKLAGHRPPHGRHWNSGDFEPGTSDQNRDAERDPVRCARHRNRPSRRHCEPHGQRYPRSLTVDNKTAYLGSAQTFTYVGQDVAGATTNDIVRYGGLTDGVPKWINGLKYLVNTSTTGELHGIPRSTPQVVANGFDMGGSSITRSALQLLLSQRRARIKESSLKSTLWYTHDSQVQSLKEIGYDLQYIPLNGGEASKFDPFFRGCQRSKAKPSNLASTLISKRGTCSRLRASGV